MAKLIYSVIASLDGYAADEDGNFDWAVPDEEVHAFINDLEQPVGTYLYGRRMYETMAGWEIDPTLPEQSPLMRDFAEIWQSADRIVYSKTLQTVSTARMRIERDFDPEAVRKMKSLAERDHIVGGPELAAQAFEAGLVDECHLFVAPVVVGGGKRSLPRQAAAIGCAIRALKSARARYRHLVVSCFPGDPLSGAEPRLALWGYGYVFECLFWGVDGKLANLFQAPCVLLV
jgi:dihydrofolate reductase